jgi:hypothetical protein
VGADIYKYLEPLSLFQGLATFKKQLGFASVTPWRAFGKLWAVWSCFESEKRGGYEVDSIISYAFEQNIMTIKNDQLFKVALIDSYHDEVQYTPCTAHSPFLRRWLRTNGKDC